MFLLLMRIQGLSLATLVQFSERQDLGRVRRPRRELLLRHDRDPLQGHVLLRRSNKYINREERDELQKTNDSIVFSRDYSRLRTGIGQPSREKTILSLVFWSSSLS